jgi:hypothetical protein
MLSGAPASFESDLNLLKKFMRTSCLTAGCCRCTLGTAAALLVLVVSLGVLIFMEARNIVKTIVQKAKDIDKDSLAVGAQINCR